MCSHTGIPAPSRIVCAGLDKSSISSMFNESMPTNRTPEFARRSHAAAVRKGFLSK